MGIEEFSRDISQLRVIKGKLALQSAVRHASTALEHGQGLLQNLLKGHGALLSNAKT